MTKDYSKGKIYRVVCNETGNTYYGSTIQSLSQRLTNHRSCYNRWRKGKSNYTTIFIILEINNYSIVWVEDYPCENNYQLQARERHFIENNNCVNKVIPTRTQKEYYKKYYEENKDKILNTVSEYYEENKEQISIRRKQDNQLNPEKRVKQRQKYRVNISNYNKEYVEKNKDKIKERHSENVICECGAEITRQCLSRHKKTKKHQDLLSTV